jgi:hypothetical protein
MYFIFSVVIGRHFYEDGTGEAVNDLLSKKP